MCGGADKLNARWREDQHGRYRWFVGCWSTRCPEGGAYLRALAQAVDAPAGSALLDDPARYLGVQAHRDDPAARATLPSPAALAAWRQRLWTTPEALDWLRDDRGLRDDTIRERELGLTDRGITFPVVQAGRLVNVLMRAWPTGEPKYRGLQGHRQQLYPRPLPVRRRPWGLLVAGMLDAVLARQEGLPAIASTGGAQLKADHADLLARVWRRVAVVYDVGEEERAARVVARLREHGAKALVVRLPLEEEGADLTDYLVTAGRTADDVLALVRRARRAG